MLVDENTSYHPKCVVFQKHFVPKDALIIGDMKRFDDTQKFFIDLSEKSISPKSAIFMIFIFSEGVIKFNVRNQILSKFLYTH